MSSSVKPMAVSFFCPKVTFPVKQISLPAIKCAAYRDAFWCQPAHIEKKALIANQVPCIYISSHFCSNSKPAKLSALSYPSSFSLNDYTEQFVNSSSKLEMSESEVRMGTKGAFIDRLSKAFQFTFSNQGWFRISSGETAPRRSRGFFSSSLMRKC